MKFINNTLYIEHADFISAGWKDAAVWNANLRNGSRWQMIKDPEDRRCTLVEYEPLREAHKEKLTAHFGNPYEHIAKQPIKKMIVPDVKAEIFYREYQYDGGKQLPFPHQQAYTKAASWLNMLLKLNEDKRIIKKELNLSLEKFWEAVTDIIKTDSIELPASYQRLITKMKQYQITGYECLVDWKFGNKNTAKLGKTEEGFCEERLRQQETIINKLARLPQNLDITQITSSANQVFEKNGWQTISAATVANIMAKNMTMIVSQRRGTKVYNNTTAMQVKRKAPDFPTLYWTMDGWTVEALYQEGNKFDNRLCVVVVLDACNKYPVGYAIGERENTELIRMALRNAIIHMQQLFGATYRPWDLQSDNYGIKNLSHFYGAVSKHHIPAAVGNAKAKIIEPYFNYLNKTYFRTKFNTSGHNITSRPERQPNFEHTNVIKHSLPTKDELIEQINRAMLKERMSKLEDYRSRWEAMPVEDQITLTPTDCIEVFGKAHPHLNSITGQGIIATLENTEYTFDSFDPAFRDLQYSTRFKLVYDVADMSQVIAYTEDGKQKFVLHNKMVVGMSTKNTTPEHLEYRNKINQFNQQRKEEIIQTYILEDALVNEIVDNTPLNLNNDDEAALKLMFTSNGQQKERLQDAKGLKKIKAQEQRIEEKATAKETATAANDHHKYLANKIDINQYLD